MTALLQRIHGNTQHAGAFPGGVHSGVSSHEHRPAEAAAAAGCGCGGVRAGRKLRDAIRALSAQLEQREEGGARAPPERIESWIHPEGGDFHA